MRPDGRTLWFSRWLYCVVLSDTGQAHWHAASLPSISFASSSFTSSSDTVAVTKMDTGPLACSCGSWEAAMMGGGTLHLAPQRKHLCLGSHWWHPFATVRYRYTSCEGASTMATKPTWKIREDGSVAYVKDRFYLQTSTCLWRHCVWNDQLQKIYCTYLWKADFKMNQTIILNSIDLTFRWVR